MITLIRSTLLSLFFLATASPLYALSAQTKPYMDLLGSLSDQTFEIQDFFFITDGKIFLLTVENSGYRIQHYMPNFSYATIHDENDMMFDIINFNLTTRMLNIGSTILDSAHPNYNDAQSLQNESHAMRYLYWDYSGDKFIAAQTSAGGVSVWYKSANNKFQPLYNAVYLDEITADNNTFTSVILRGSTIVFGNYDLDIILDLEAEREARESQDAGYSNSGPTPP